MNRLVPAVLELRIVGVALLAAGSAATAGVLAGGAPGDPRAAGLGFAAGLAVLWAAWVSRSVRTAIRLAMPARARWSPEDLGTTIARALAFHVVPVCASVIAAGSLAADSLEGAPAIAAGAVAGAGATALMAARRVRQAEAALGRRVLREPRWGAPLGRRSLYLEPRALSEVPDVTRAAPWPAHRPPPRAQRSAIELDPANHAARHAVGVGTRTGRAAASPAPARPPAGSPPP